MHRADSRMRLDEVLRCEIRAGPQLDPRNVHALDGSST